jgi:hypothetical protein
VQGPLMPKKLRNILSLTALIGLRYITRVMLWLSHLSKRYIHKLLIRAFLTIPLRSLKLESTLVVKMKVAAI